MPPRAWLLLLLAALALADNTCLDEMQAALRFCDAFEEDGALERCQLLLTLRDPSADDHRAADCFEAAALAINDTRIAVRVATEADYARLNASGVPVPPGLFVHRALNQTRSAAWAARRVRAATLAGCSALLGRADSDPCTGRELALAGALAAFVAGLVYVVYAIYSGVTAGMSRLQRDIEKLSKRKKTD